MLFEDRDDARGRPTSGSAGPHGNRLDRVPDAEVTEASDRASDRRWERRATGAKPARAGEDRVAVPAGAVELQGQLTVPQHPVGIVIFAHGSGSSRHSPRNRYVAEVLNRAGLATLLIDLLTAGEETDRAHVFDIAGLSRRLVAVTAWLSARDEFTDLPLGYFGASTGAGAALRAAADPTTRVAAVVSRGGRPDLAGPAIAEVTAPTLLIVGGNDPAVVTLNRNAAAAMSTEVVVTLVPGATHLFAEPGALEQVAELARAWFVQKLTSDAPERSRGTEET